MTENQLKEISQYLKGENYDCTLIDANNEKCLLINITIKNLLLELRCVFPKAFPYVFPKFYLNLETYNILAPIPHISDSGYICLFDTNVSIPNFDKPKELVVACIEKSIEVIINGIDGKNGDDFSQEFNAYWANSSEQIYSLFTPPDKPSVFPYFCNRSFTFYIAQDKTRLKEFLNYSFGVETSLIKIETCLFLPITCMLQPPFPKTNAEMLIWLKSIASDDCYKAYLRYLGEKRKKYLIIFSQVINGNIHLSAWIHFSVKTPSGFRGSKTYSHFFLMGSNRNDDIYKLNVNQLNYNRLFTRGGSGCLEGEAKVSILGCGSIGSFIVRSLVELGMRNLVLIDNEKLSAENVARHFCGASYVGKEKVKAIREALIKHYPDINCEAINTDIFEVFENELEVLNSCDYNFIIVGNLPIEIKSLRLFCQSEIKKPIVLIWVEPYLLGGHAVIIQKMQDVESILFNEDYSFKYNILEDGHMYAKNDAGCGSTYIPYSAFEAQQFVYSFLDYFHNHVINKKIDGNFLFSWCGKVDWARRNGFKLSDGWLAKKDREYIIKRLDDK